jgi:hypothetical protein
MVYNAINQNHVPGSTEDAYKWAIGNPNFVKQKTVYKTNDMKYIDIITVSIAVYALNSKVIQHKAQQIYAEAIQNHDMPDMSLVVDWLFRFSKKRARGIMKLHDHCIKKYGFVLPYIVSDNKFVGDWSLGYPNYKAIIE